MIVADLRAKAATRRENAILHEALCLDSELTEQLTNAAAAVDRLQYVEDIDDLDAQIAAATKELERVRQQIDDASIVLTFRQLTPTDYEALVQQYRTDSDGVDAAAFYPALCRESYLQTTNLAGEDVGLTWDELDADVLSHGDRDHMAIAVLAHNRTSSVVPYTAPQGEDGRGQR